MLLRFPDNWPRYREGSTLMKMPEITPFRPPISEADEMLLTMLRPYYNDPNTLFTVLDALMQYYHDELAV